MPPLASYQGDRRRLGDRKMSGISQMSTILAAGGGFDFFTLIGVGVFFLISFIAKRAQKVAEEKARREEKGSGSAPVPQTAEAKPQKRDLWSSLEEQLREIMGEQKPPRESPSELAGIGLETRPMRQRVEIPPRQPASYEDEDDFSGTVVPATPVLSKEIEVRKIASAPKARGVGNIRHNLKSELSQLRSKITKHVRGEEYEEDTQPIGSIKATRMESGDVPAYRLSQKLKSPGSIQDFIVLSAVLGPPKALSEESDLYEKY